MKPLYLLTFVTLFFLPVLSSAESRWYDQSAVDRGAGLFKQNCASCHGVNAESTPEWKVTDANGNYPPPPLNGSAHAWHHSKELLKQTIREGGVKLGGVMPAFEDKFSEQDLDALVAYFQSKWPDDIYQKWAGRFKVGELAPIAPIEEKTTEKASTATDNEMTRLLNSRLGTQASASNPIKTPVAGIYETQFGTQYGYLSADGRYIILGNLIDLKTGKNLTDIAKGKTALIELDKVSLDDKVIFPAIGEEKAVLNVFTDTTCPYCKKLHEQVDKLQQAGISIHYLPYPRGSKQGPGYESLRQVWCAKDKQAAMGIAKGLDIGDLPDGNCEKGNFVDEGYVLGNRVGVTGTPASFKANGEIIQGFVPYSQLIPMVLKD